VIRLVVVWLAVVSGAVLFAVVVATALPPRGPR